MSSRPPYELPDDIEDRIRKECDQHYEAEDEIQAFVVVLPFCAAPMWPPDAERTGAYADFCFCVCPKCERPIGQPRARLCLCFTVVQLHATGARHVYWRPRLSCCDQTRVGVSPCASILGVEMALKHVFNTAFRAFDDRVRVPKRRCYVCEAPLPCDNEICASVLEKVSFKQTCDERMHNLLNHFKAQGVDAVSALIDRAGACAAQGCAKRVNPAVACKGCRHAAYCSKQCRARSRSLHRASGECVSFLKIWDW